MGEKYSQEEIFTHWTQQAKIHGQSYAASWSDIGVIELEIREILKHIQTGDRVLDVGCANGFTTLALAGAKQIQIRGLDYIPEMIAEAGRRLLDQTDGVRGRASFAVGDITDLRESEGAWDKVVVIRVLINLGNWENQRQALVQCSRMLRPGGLLLLSEATIQGWDRLNAFRREWGLADIPMPAFNTYLDDAKVIAASSGLFEAVEVSDFASSYYVGTRVLKPLLAKLAGTEERVADPLAEWNRWVSLMPAAGDYGTQKLFVLRRR